MTSLEQRKRKGRKTRLYVSCFDFIIAWQETCDDLFASPSLAISSLMGEAAATKPNASIQPRLPAAFASDPRILPRQPLPDIINTRLT
jgi:hypothetical protein